MKAKKLLGLVCVCALSIYSMLGCTRQGASTKMSVSIPIDINRSQSGTACGGSGIQFMQAEVIVGGQTLYATPLQNQNGNGVQGSGGVYTLTIDNVPTNTSLTVAALAVVSNNDGSIGFEFGKTTETWDGSSAVPLQLSQSGGASEQVQIAGRLMIGGVYPSGTLQIYYNPPATTGMASLLVQESPIIGGWFNGMAVNGAGNSFTYKLKETGQVLLNAINPDLPTAPSPDPNGCSATPFNTGCPCALDPLSGGCPFAVNGLTSKVLVDRPGSWSVNSNNNKGCASQNGHNQYLLGWFGDAAAMSTFEGNKVCYGNDVREGMSGLYDSQSMANPLDIDFTGGALNQPNATTILVGGGQPDTQSSLYIGTSSYCPATTVSNGNALVLNHLLLTNNDNSFGGFSVPFQMINPLGGWGQQFVTMAPNKSSTNATWSIGSNPTVSVTFTPGSNTISFTGTPTINVGDAVSGPGAAPGATVQSVSVNSLTITVPNSTIMTGPTSEFVNWTLLSGSTATVNSGGMTYASGIATLNNVYIPGGNPPPTVGMYVIGADFPAGTTITSITGSPMMTMGTSQAPINSCATVCTVTFSALAGMDIYAKYSLGGYGAVASSSNSSTVLNVPNANAFYIGMPINTNSGPQMQNGPFGLGQNLAVTAVSATTVAVNGAVSGWNSGTWSISFNLSGTNFTGTATLGSAVISSVSPSPTGMVGNTANVNSINGSNGGTLWPQGTVASTVTSNSVTLSNPVYPVVQFSAGDSSTNGNNNDCSQIQSQGFYPITNQPPLPAAPVAGYTFDGNVTIGGATVNPGFINTNWDFALCPYNYATSSSNATVAVGQKNQVKLPGTTLAKNYIGNYQIGQSNPGSTVNNPFGWAHSDGVLNLSSATWTQMATGSNFVQSVTPPSGSGIMQFTGLTLGATGIPNFGTGDEVLLTVVGASGYGCGPNVSVGMTATARVLDGSGYWIDIPSGSWIDSVVGANMASVTIGDSNYCWIQATNMPQYRTVTIGSGGITSAPATNGFLYENTGGGVLAFAVNGTFTLGGNVSVDGTGFTGGASAAFSGAGSQGEENGSDYFTGSGGGGAPTVSNGGGGGAGVAGGGAPSTDNTMGGQNSGSGGNGGFVPALALGGGGGDGGEGASAPGGNGGGAIWIAANNIVIPAGNIVFSANGQNGAGSVHSGGGGGGGTVAVTAGSVTLQGSATLLMQANGGSETSGSGGVGGGGSVSLNACSISGPAPTLSAVIGVGNGGSTNTNAGTGVTFTGSSNTNWCLTN